LQWAAVMIQSGVTIEHPHCSICPLFFIMAHCHGHECAFAIRPPTMYGIVRGVNRRLIPQRIVPDQSPFQHMFQVVRIGIYSFCQFIILFLHRHPRQQWYKPVCDVACDYWRSHFLRTNWDWDRQTADAETQTPTNMLFDNKGRL